MKVFEKSVKTFDKNNEPLGTIELGEVVKFVTQDCFGGQVKDESFKSEFIDLSNTNPAAGPVYINGVEPGDVLAIDILNIDVADHGATTTTPGEGPLADTLEMRTKIIPIEDGFAKFNDIRWKTDTMIGVIGLAPAGEPVPTGFPFRLGGNMDCSRIRKGTTLYIPVEVEGGLLQMGDLHATMGDGEIVGTGIEIAGEVTLRTRVIKNFDLKWPVLEDQDHWYVIAISDDENMGIAMTNALREMQRLISNAYGWDLTDAAMYLSLQGNCQTCQTCLDPGFPCILRVEVPKVDTKPALIK